MTMGKNLQSIWDSLSTERKNSIEEKAITLEDEYLTLQKLREVAGLTQVKVSEKLSIPQSNVSRIEKNSDMLLSTLKQYVEAVGGKLRISVEIPNKNPIMLSIGDINNIIQQSGETQLD